MFSKTCKKILCCAIVLILAQNSIFVSAQTQVTTEKTLDRYIDQIGGTTADEAVRLALENNGELAAARKEFEAAQALVKQARLRPNPSLETIGAKQINGADTILGYPIPFCVQLSE